MPPSKSSDRPAADIGSVLLYARIDPNRIWYLKFILEGYDGLAVLSTEQNRKGVVRIAVFRGRYDELILILQSVAEQITRKKTQG